MDRDDYLEEQASRDDVADVDGVGHGAFVLHHDDEEEAQPPQPVQPKRNATSKLLSNKSQGESSVVKREVTPANEKDAVVTKREMIMMSGEKKPKPSTRIKEEELEDVSISTQEQQQQQAGWTSVQAKKNRKKGAVQGSPSIDAEMLQQAQDSAMELLTSPKKSDSAPIKSPTILNSTGGTNSKTIASAPTTLATSPMVATPKNTTPTRLPVDFVVPAPFDPQPKSFAHRDLVKELDQSIEKTHLEMPLDLSSKNDLLTNGGIIDLDPNYVAVASAALTKMAGTMPISHNKTVNITEAPTSNSTRPVSSTPSVNGAKAKVERVKKQPIEEEEKVPKKKADAVNTGSNKKSPVQLVTATAEEAKSVLSTASSATSSSSSSKKSATTSSSTVSQPPKNKPTVATTTTMADSSNLKSVIGTGQASAKVSTKKPSSHSSSSAAPSTSNSPDPTRLAREWEFKHQLPQDLSKVILHVGEPKIFGASPTALGVIGSTGGAAVVLGTVTSSISDGHVRFKITRSIENDPEITPQFVHRRYRDFQALFLRLAHCYPNLLLPALPSSWATLVKTEEFLQTRARRLEGYLVSLLNNRPAIWRSQDLQAFLVKDSEAFDEMATKYLSNNGQDLNISPPSVSSKFGESLSYWVKTAQASILSAPQAVGAGGEAFASTTYQAGELASSFEALNAYVDENGQVQERATVVERLTSAFESYLQLTQSRANTLKQLQDSLYDFAIRGEGEDVSTSLIQSLEVFDPAFDVGYGQGLVGEPKALASDTDKEGPLRRLHQCAALLSGAKEVNTRFANKQSTPNSHTDSVSAASTTNTTTGAPDIPAFTKQFATLRKQTSKMSIKVSKEFAQLSLDRVTMELSKLNEIKAAMLNDI
jgi:hypothetical protein